MRTFDFGASIIIALFAVGASIGVGEALKDAPCKSVLIQQTKKKEGLIETRTCVREEHE